MNFSALSRRVRLFFNTGCRYITNRAAKTDAWRYVRFLCTTETKANKKGSIDKQVGTSDTLQQLKKKKKPTEPCQGSKVLANHSCYIIKWPSIVQFFSSTISWYYVSSHTPYVSVWLRMHLRSFIYTVSTNTMIISFCYCLQIWYICCGVSIPARGIPQGSLYY